MAGETFEQTVNDAPPPPSSLRLVIRRPSIYETGTVVRQDPFINEVKRRNKDDDQANQNVTEDIGIIGGGKLILQTVIGPGIFTSPKGVADFGGSIGISYIVWTISGIFSTLAALCFVELQLSVPRAGCEYGYIHKAFGKLPTFIYTWMKIALAEPATTAVFCIAFADYVADSIHDKCGPSDSNRILLAILTVVTLTLLNCTMKNLARAINTASNIGKIVAISTVIGGGIYNICRNRERAIKGGFEFSKTSFHALSLAFHNSLWAYGGWANVPHVTTGVKKPPQNLPRLILIIIPFVTIVYLLTVTSFFTVLTRDELIGAEAIGVGWGEEMYKPLGYVIPLFVCLIAFGNANGTVMQAGRTASVAVHDGYIPEFIAYIHHRTNIHIPAVTGRCFATIMLIIFVDVGALVRFYVFTVWLFHGITVCGLLILRYRRRKTYTRKFKVHLVIPIIVVIFSLFIVVGPFAIWPPRMEFAFSIGVLVLSSIMFVPFGKAKGLVSIFDKVAIAMQLLMNVVPPKIKRHRMKSLNVRRKSTFSPASPNVSKSPDVTPVKFSTSPSVDVNGNFKWPSSSDAHKRIRFSLTPSTALNRSLSSVSFHSMNSVDYCDVLHKFQTISHDGFDTSSCGTSSYPPSLLEFNIHSRNQSPRTPQRKHSAVAETDEHESQSTDSNEFIDTTEESTSF